MGNKSGINRRITSIVRTLSGAREVDVPTYERDWVGEVQQWDERDILFARHDLHRYFDADVPEYQDYYRAHPKRLEYDQKIASLPELGSTGGVDSAMSGAQFVSVSWIAAESFVDGEPAPHQVDIPADRAATKVKALARLLGADLVKIGPLRQEWVYSHVGRSFGNREGHEKWGAPVDLRHHPHAIALGFEMDYDLIQSAPDFPALLATAKGYAIGAWISIQLATYIRMLGHSARAHHLYNYRLLAVPVAVDCGLGELSRAGYLLTREFGLGLRLAVVTTDMPLAHDRPVDIGVQSFCDACQICADNCPIGAIPSGGKVEFNGIEKWKLDEEKCYRYWHAVGSDCSLCMTTCPWTKPRTRFHRSMSWLAGIEGPHQSWMVQADKLFYGKRKAVPRPEYMEPRAH
jgi:reductive dehalogenase